MKFFKNIKGSLLALFVLGMISLLGGVVYAAVAPGSVKYEGPNTPALGEPAFNGYYDVPGVGNESDFLRVKKAGEANSAYRNTVDTVCETGDVFNVWFYVHNGASVSGNNNGTGPSVAKDVMARVNLDNAAEKDRFNLRGYITSSNAGNIDDGAVIDCGDRQYKLSYVANSAKAFLDLPNQTVNLPSAIVGNGTKIGTNALDGKVWGCWEQRVWIGLDVKVEEIKKPELKPAVCDALEAIVLGSKQVRVTDVKYTANDATINNVTLNYGDGTVRTVNTNQFPQEHTYANEGEYTITATLNTTFDGKQKQVTSADCKKTIKVTEEKEPFYACENFKLTMNKRVANVRFTVTAGNGATFKDATIVYSADGSVKETSTTDQIDNGVVTDSYTFGASDERIRAEATVRFNVGDKVEEVKCSGQAVLGIRTPEEPKELPKTGAASLVGLMTAVTAVGSVAHRRFTLARNK